MTAPATAPGAPRQPEQISTTYRVAMRVSGPVIRGWGRLEADGVELLPRSGPTLVVANHDSYWDPVAIGVAGMPRRQIRALAKSSLWKIKPLAPVLDGMGQVPIERGAGDAAALDRAIAELRDGACIGVFPEGTSSRGRRLRARSGVGRLARAVPDAKLLCVSVAGTVDIVRFPRRPRIRVEFFEPAGGPPAADEEPTELSARLLAELRERAPISIPGRRRTAERYRRAAAEAEAFPPKEGTESL